MGLIIFEDGITKGNAETFNYNFNEILNMVCPIGKVEVFFDDKDHSDYLGFTWERTSIGKVPVGIDSSDTDFNTIGKTGGEKTHTLTIDELAKHHHKQQGNTTKDTSSSKIKVQMINASTINTTDTGTTLGADFGTGVAGGNQPHNNLQPYEVMAFWKRVS